MHDDRGDVKRSNCLLYALKRWRYRDDYLVIRRSRWGWWPHFLHGQPDGAGNIKVQHLTPAQPALPKGWRRWLPLHTFVFRGVVKDGDESG